MSHLSRIEVIEALLETLNDAREGITSGDGGSSDAHDSKLLRFPDVYRKGSYAELEATLRALRAHDHRAYRTVVEWYLCPWKIVQECRLCGKPTFTRHRHAVRTQVKPKLIETVSRRVAVRPENSDPERRAAGLAWLSDNWQGRRGPTLPKEVLEVRSR